MWSIIVAAVVITPFLARAILMWRYLPVYFDEQSLHPSPSHSL